MPAVAAGRQPRRLFPPAHESLPQLQPSPSAAALGFPLGSPTGEDFRVPIGFPRNAVELRNSPAHTEAARGHLMAVAGPAGEQAAVGGSRPRCAAQSRRAANTEAAPMSQRRETARSPEGRSLPFSADFDVVACARLALTPFLQRKRKARSAPRPITSSPTGTSSGSASASGPFRCRASPRFLRGCTARSPEAASTASTASAGLEKVN